MAKSKSKPPAVQELDIEALAASHEGPARTMVKVGKPQASFRFEAEVATEVTIAGHENTFAPNDASPQLTVTPDVEGETGSQIWVNFPADESKGEEINPKVDERWMEFLRAIFPSQFSVYSSIDKSDDKEWKYLDADGEPMAYADRQAKAEQVTKAAMALATQIRAGTFSLKGRKLVLFPKTNHNGKLFYRFRAVGFTAAE